MASWSQFEQQSPDLAERVRARFQATKHHVLATLRRDGSPRASGTELEFDGDEIFLGSMGGSVKARDLQRDPRFALHANPGDGSMEGGDAKISGTVEEVVAPVSHPGSHRFRMSIEEVVLTSLHPDGDRLVIETWNPGGQVRRRERR
jgi:pyridoxamine 5'-phosphate oxidase-like protein